MIKKFIYLFLFLSFSISGQQTINKLITKELTVQDKVEVTSTTKSSKPCPVMTEVQRDVISSPATGSCVYNSDSLQLNVYDGSTWQEAGGGGISLWATGLSYDVNDVVIESDRIYRCLIAHTSGTFSTDLASGNWTEVSGSIPVSLQDVYEDSNQPQITTNTSGLGIQFKRGTLDDADVVVEVLNGAGTSKFSVTGEGVVSAGSTIAATGNITGANLAGINTGNSTVDAASGYISGAGMQVVEVPNAQVTSIDLANKKVRFEFGNNNELINANMEAQTVAEGWTISNATSSSSTTGIEGSKSLSLELTGALSLSQSSTINASQKSGVQMVASIWVNSSDVSDLQLCSLKNGAEDKCTVTGGYLQGSGWRQLTVSFLGDATSNGLKLKSTDTTGTVLVDQAFVGIGSPVVDFTPDMVYSAKVSSAGDTSDENTDWVLSSSRPSTGTYNINLVSGVFNQSPNCVAITVNTGAGYPIAEIQSASITQIVVIIRNNGAGSNLAFNIICQKQGADYKTSKAYVASSSDTDWASCGHTTSDFTGFGTVSSIQTECKRKGSDLFIRGSFVVGSSTATEARLNLKINGSFLTSYPIASIQQVGTFARGAVTTNGHGGFVLIEPSVGYITFGGSETMGSSMMNPLSKINGNLINSGDKFSIQASIPIQGWTDSGVIVGSFQGYNETPGTSRVETFSVSYGKTATTVCDGTGLVNTNQCAYLDQIGNAVTSITRTTNGEYNANFSKTYSKVTCSGSSGNPTTYLSTTGRQGGVPSTLSCASCSSLKFITGSGATGADSWGTLICQGIPQ